MKVKLVYDLKGDEETLNFWNFTEDESGNRELRLDGPIDPDNSWDPSAVTPSSFREELNQKNGDLTLRINSPGGSVFAAAEIYTALKDYKGKITVMIESMAASAASVVAMAGDEVLISPSAHIMIHDPMTLAMGNIKDFEKVISTLKVIKDGIINVYQLKTGLSRSKLAKLMDDETWMDARKAVELGFADKVLFTGKEDEHDVTQNYSARAVGDVSIDRLLRAAELLPKTVDEDAGERPDGQVLESAEETNGIVESADTDNASETDAASETDVDSTTETVSEPIIGKDGKTQDGSMPYELLSMQLELLK